MQILIIGLKSEQMNSLIRLFVIIFVLSILKMMIPTSFSVNGVRKT